MKSLKDLFVSELAEMYYAEKQLVRTLPKLAKAATSPELKDAITTPENQVRKLEEVFLAADEKVSSKTCGPILSITESAEKLISELEGACAVDAVKIRKTSE